MRGAMILTVAAVLSLIALPCVHAYAEPGELIEKCAKVFDEVNQMPERAMPGLLLKNCAGIAIFPETFNAAMGLGWRKGQGVVVYRDPKTGQWSNPVIMTLRGASVGFHAGSQKVDLVLIIRSKEALEGMLKSKFNIGNQASLTVGPIGRSWESGLNLDTGESGGIYTYSRTKGLFAGSALKGMRVRKDDKANTQYYGQALQAEEILFSNKGQADAAAQELKKILDKYTK